jgi:hypothetical protein
MKVGVLATMIFGALISFPIASFAGLAPDADSDGIPDVLDKCMNDSRNATLTCDTDQDGYGNVCDGDFNQSNTVTSADYSMFFVPVLNMTQTGRGEDMNCSSGTVTSADYSMFFVPQLNMAPGASGLACAGTIPCN